ncbi:MAG: molybdopterin binding domain-containing protein [Candidatus Desulfovibrio kirbyi]|uniref:Molybdopterin binding domain-containing protein n=1 Tax=Candidatus Desulfovibrio kirbyi TaxID=2696086 RepID=A0A6L2R4C7_9BACT|nr:MAG: molybdopterin binding domain-containing protein [Candidatus Desulfovibrio kirbyi]
MCGEGFPERDGVICRGCQGEAPYSDASSDAPVRRHAVVPLEEAVGKYALHDMISIVPGRFKGAAFRAGQKIVSEDLARLREMGRFAVAVRETADGDGAAERALHENEAAAALAKRLSGANVVCEDDPVMGRADFAAGVRGVFTVDARRLAAVNMLDNVQAVTRQDGTVVEAKSAVAAVRVLPLYLTRQAMAEALSLLDCPLFSVLPLRRARVGILVTGTEISAGIIEDKFIPVISAKAAGYACEVVENRIVPDDAAKITQAVRDMRGAGVDLLVVTGGLSVDPGDVTLTALRGAGLADEVYGAPVLPGSMMLVGTLPGETGGKIQVIGVPACALYHKTTLFDALLPRLLAGRAVTRREIARMGEGGLCMHCKVCTYPKCFFMK